MKTTTRTSRPHIVGTPISPQAHRVWNLMERDRTVTRLSAMHYGIANLTARIAELRNAGVLVDCEERTDAEGRRYGRWSIAPNNGSEYVPRFEQRAA